MTKWDGTADREIARLRNFDISISDGYRMLSGTFEYGEDGTVCQGLGYIVDMDFVVRFMEAVGVERLQEVNGKSVWVTHTHSSILKIEPLFKKDGKVFDVQKWEKEKENDRN